MFHRLSRSATIITARELASSTNPLRTFLLRDKQCQSKGGNCILILFLTSFCTFNELRSLYKCRTLSWRMHDVNNWAYSSFSLTLFFLFWQFQPSFLLYNLIWLFHTSNYAFLMNVTILFWNPLTPTRKMNKKSEQQQYHHHNDKISIKWTTTKTSQIQKKESDVRVCGNLLWFIYSMFESACATRSDLTLFLLEEKNWLE